jgi:hypothetical protein
MPQMRKQKESARLWQLFCEDIEEKLIISNPHRGGERQSGRPQYRRVSLGKSRLISAGGVLMVFFLLLACIHTPETMVVPVGNKQTFDADEKIILKAIAQVFKDRGFGEAKVEQEKGRLETDFVTQGDWRTKAAASLKKLNRKEREVTLSVSTEKQSAGKWQPRDVMGKDQYEKLFYEIDLQIYREWAKPQ